MDELPMVSPSSSHGRRKCADFDVDLPCDLRGIPLARHSTDLHTEIRDLGTTSRPRFRHLCHHLIVCPTSLPLRFMLI